MTKEEALAKIKELEEFVKNIDNDFGYKDDKIFLLSAEEYEKYKDAITKYCVNVKDWWWLRSPGVTYSLVASVRDDGSTDYGGCDVSLDDNCVRPAFKFRHSSDIKIGGYRIVSSTLFKNNAQLPARFDVVKIADGKQYDLYLSDLPLFWDTFDDDSNDYENSHIRQKLLNWWKNLS